MLNGYSCNCSEGTGGLNCEQDIDECASFPCQNGGTCVDLLNGYSCNCSEGTVGLNCYQGFLDCKDIADSVTSATSGIYEILLWQSAKTLTVYCDMVTDGGRWTVFQNRFDGSVEFYRNLSEYIKGFGDINGEFWLGLGNLQELVALGPSELRIDVSSLGGSEGYETFQDFSISPGPGYTLNIALGIGTIGDSTSQGLSFNNNGYFSTFDRDMDQSSTHCASFNEGAWWYTSCMYVHLNGQYCTPGTTICGYRGMIYYSFLNLESFLTSRMMFRRI
ncbi:microfibril-associated glycoprotein 4-like [Mercenaria mercenaria]|uniref:microfibril-associated glycoprotein 4-like n=1 Tax=Mercenaria mercenaria TaxID=6596 RepID=UPI00234E9704|nr:microfibril-associated glycoprotein 4-like [Mercenaria mercenaria]